MKHVSEPVKRKILVVDDEPDIRELVRYNLERVGFRVLEAQDGEAALRMVNREQPALVVLDLNLPGANGLEICRTLRGERGTVALPIVMLTAKAGEVDRVVGLEFGADDYVTKPFSPRELVARVGAVLRRSERASIGREAAVYEHGRLRINFNSHEAWLDAHAVDLSPLEFDLLKFFVRNSNRVYDRLTILDLVWGDTHVEPRTVDAHVRRLRQLIERDPANPALIRTVHGAGYKFDDRALMA
jgi:two-component system alkaline phosphatase synthesis response regulator PhoP